MQNNDNNTDFTPSLIAGLPIKFLPTSIIEPIIDKIFKNIIKKHPNLFDRLKEYEDALFIIEPKDLDIKFLLYPSSKNPYLRISKDENTECRARIKGNIDKLIELLQGNTDGDALFFSRDISIEGDTEAVVALRNAIDSNEIDILSDILPKSKNLQKPIRSMIDGIKLIHNETKKDMKKIQNAIISPALKRIDNIEDDIDDINKKIKSKKRS